MRYDDFVYFMLSEEDKATSASLRYWFECVDLDADGAVTPRDMRHFYDTQVSVSTSLWWLL
jgi:serine/threonine-protein phosphatase 2A regulatory subunit B''